MDKNCNNKTNNLNNKYNIDHIYCHTNENTNYIRTVNTGSLDIMTLLKENKQLKAMLLLHLDMIQDQSDQLLAKDKLLSGLRDENEILKQQIDKYERNYGTSIINNNHNTTHNKIFHKNYNKNSDIQQVKKILAANRIEEKKENLHDFTNVAVVKETTKITNKRNTNTSGSNSNNDAATRNQQTSSPNIQQQQSTSSSSAAASIPETKYKICDGGGSAASSSAYTTNNNSGSSGSIIGQSNGKLISKIILHRVTLPDSMVIPKIEPNIDEFISEEFNDTNLLLHDIQTTIPSSTQSQIPVTTTVVGGPLSIEVPSIFVNQQKLSDNQSCNTNLLLAHDEIEIKTEKLEEDYNDYPTIYDKNVTTNNILPKSESRTISINETKNFHKKNINDNKLNIISAGTSGGGAGGTGGSGGQGGHGGSDNKRKCNMLTTTKHYSVREWIDEEIPPQEWSNKEEEKALKADEPMLEVPKWTVKEFSGLYSIEGTEDLSDEIFLKRHAKLEHDEKRRKKWDAQRIREQRTIERLKRRHCKDELHDNLDNQQDISSFYSTPDSIKYIEISDELPVIAFGEGIPTLNTCEFHLPWLQRHQQQQQHNDMLKAMAAGSGSSCGQNSLIQNSTFVFLKKRKRQQSFTVTTNNYIRRRKSQLNNNLTTIMSLVTSSSSNSVNNTTNVNVANIKLNNNC